MEMKRQYKLGTMILLTVLMVAACGANSLTSASDPTYATIDRYDQRSLPCASYPKESRCANLEQQILDSVVRLEIYFEDEDLSSGRAKRQSHGTIKDGRYLVVHNHFQVSFSPSSRTNEEIALTVALYKATGETLMLHTGSLPFSVAVEEEETLVLDFGTKSSGQGYFEWLGMRSASFLNWRDVQLQRGDVVAQIDHDGESTRVVWTTIKQLVTDKGVPKAILSNSVSTGASGGGVFWNGQHVANNWQVIDTIGEGGVVLEQVSTAALNSHQVSLLSS